MPKITWNEFRARHGRLIAIVAIHPVLPKELLDSLRRDGYPVRTPSDLLSDTLHGLIHGDWAVRTETVPNDQPGPVYRKAKRTLGKRSIILVAESADVQIIQSAIGRVSARAERDVLPDCDRQRNLAYGRQEYVQLVLDSGPQK